MAISLGKNIVLPHSGYRNTMSLVECTAYIQKLGYLSFSITSFYAYYILRIYKDHSKAIRLRLLSVQFSLALSILQLFFSIDFIDLLFPIFFYLVSSVWDKHERTGDLAMLEIWCLFVCVYQLLEIFPHYSSLKGYLITWLGSLVAFSYFSAGLSKALTKEWWTPLALQRLTIISPILTRNQIKKMVFTASPNSLRNLGILLIAWELSFPLFLFNETLTYFAIGSAIAFHALNVYIFGLSRFFWNWLCVLPSLLWLSSVL